MVVLASFVVDSIDGRMDLADASSERIDRWGSAVDRNVVVVDVDAAVDVVADAAVGNSCHKHVLFESFVHFAHHPSSRVQDIQHLAQDV